MELVSKQDLQNYAVMSGTDLEIVEGAYITDWQVEVGTGYNASGTIYLTLDFMDRVNAEQMVDLLYKNTGKSVNLAIL